MTFWPPAEGGLEARPTGVWVQAPQAGLNNRTVGSETLSPAKRKQEVTDPKLCLPPPENFLRPSYARPIRGGSL